MFVIWVCPSSSPPPPSLPNIWTGRGLLLQPPKCPHQPWGGQWLGPGKQQLPAVSAGQTTTATCHLQRMPAEEAVFHYPTGNHPCHGVQGGGQLRRGHRLWQRQLRGQMWCFVPGITKLFLFFFFYYYYSFFYPLVTYYLVCQSCWFFVCWYITDIDKGGSTEWPVPPT